MDTLLDKRPVAVITGAGPGNGQALARRFSDAGYAVAMLARNAAKVQSLAAEIPHAKGFMCDVGDTTSVAAAFAAVRGELGEVEVLVHNAGSGVFAGIESVTAEQFEAAWRVNALGAFLCSKEVVPSMSARGRGSIVFIGATASRRGGVKTVAFAPAKAAQRILAESMAKALWPQGIHVAVVIIDGAIDLPGSRERMPDKPAEAFIPPGTLAETVHMLTQQNRQGWSFEVEVRPFAEVW